MTAIAVMPGVQSLRILRGSNRGCASAACRSRSWRRQDERHGRTHSRSSALAAHHPHNGGEAPEVSVLDHERMALEEREDGRLLGPFASERRTSRRCSSVPSAGHGHRRRSEPVPRAPLDTSRAGRRGRPAEVASRQSTGRSGSRESRRKTPFAVDESHDLVRIELEPRTHSFLLIVRTGRIVTAHVSNRIHGV